MAREIADAIIRVRDITVQFGKTRVLDGLNLDVRRGEILGFVGPSGAGKSVLTRTIIGLVPKVAGRIEVFGVDLDKASTLAKPDRDAVKKDADILIKQANAVKSRTSDGKLATAELRQLVEQVAKLQTFVGAHPIPTMTNWEAVQTSLGKLQQAFGLTP